MSSPDGVNTGQKYVQPQVKLGIANKKRLLYISLDTVWSLGVLAGQVKGPRRYKCQGRNWGTFGATFKMARIFGRELFGTNILLIL